jgi:AraC-like DNA-binding protein
MINQPEIEFLKYFVANHNDEAWGMITTTTGFQEMKSRDKDPILERHPSGYSFKSSQGRILNEYQLVYIVDGKGVFRSSSIKLTKVNAGTMFLLFPGEWHTYYPYPSVGWKEYWIGFKGPVMENRVRAGFFSKEDPLCNIGISESIISRYNEIINIASKDKIGSQQVISSIALSILGSFYYKRLNSIENQHTRIINMLNQARCQMRENLGESISLEELVRNLGMGYSWFRRMFKKYEGISPKQYLIQLKVAKIKELLTTTDMSISEIADQVGIENKSQLSTFFKKHEGIKPSDFRV